MSTYLYYNDWIEGHALTLKPLYNHVTTLINHTVQCYTENHLSRCMCIPCVSVCILCVFLLYESGKMALVIVSQIN